MKIPSLFAVAAFSLISFVQSNALAAPRHNHLLTIETVKTLSCTIANWHLDENNKIKLFMIDHSYIALPDKARTEVEQLRGDEKGEILWVYNSKTAYHYDRVKREYDKFDAQNSVADNFNFALPHDRPQHVLLNGKSTLLFTKSVIHDNGTKTVQRTWYDATTHETLLITGSFVGTKHHDGLAYKVVFSDWKLNPKLPASLFAFVPPPGVKLKPNPPDIDYTAKFLKPGAIAPDFALTDGSGKVVHLSDYAGKVVLLDFWATWCGPCQESLPDTNAVARKFAGQVVTLGVNVYNTSVAFQKWLPSHKNLDSITFIRDGSPLGKDVASVSYGVIGIPSQYVIGKDGKVVRAFCAGAPEDLTAALNLALSPTSVTH